MRKEEKILTRLVMGALLAGSVGVWMPQTAMATEGDVAQATSTELTVTSESTNENGVTISNTDNVYGNVTYEKGGNVYNIVTATVASTANMERSALGASDYTVTINSGDIQTVYGGAGSGAADGNTIIINGGTMGEVYAGYGVTSASNNTITMNGGTVGYLRGGNASDGSGTASNNTINVLGGTVTDGIYAGMGGFTDGSANNNTINILVPLTLQHDINLGESATVSGGTLNIAAKGVSAERVVGASNINFYLPSDIEANDIMLTITGAGTYDTNLTGVTFGVAALSGVSLNKGDTVTLVKSTGTTLTTDATLTTVDSSTLGSASFLSLKNLDTVNTYTLSISKSGDNAIIATVDNVTGSSTDDSSNSNSGNDGDSGASDNSSNSGSSSSSSSSRSDVKKNTVETRAAAVSMLTQGSDFLASTGFSEAANAVSQAAAEAQASGVEAPAAVSFTPFAAVGGQKMRAESGSHVDIKGFGLNVGFAREVANKDGKLLFGPVVEYGRGSYDSYNNDVHGDGNSSYWGLGLMARQTNHDGLYYEGSVRGGRSKSDYASSVTVAGVPVNISYDSSSTYWSAHLGLGKIVSLNKNNTLDGYIKYFYTHQGGDTVTIVGAPMAFDAVNSHRVRLGGRLTHKLNDKDSIYGGLAYQYEFGGEARATYNGTATPAPSVKGGSGMLELGYNVKASDKVTLDFGVTGWAGKQRGITGQIGALWKF